MARFSAQHSLLLLCLCFVFSSCSAKTVQVSDICSKHSNPSTCVTILYSISPGVELGVEVDSLSRYIINMAHTHAFDTVGLINSLIENTTDQSWFTERYVSCATNYSDVLLYLTQANDSYKSGDYNGMYSNGAIARRDVLNCDLTQQNASSTLTDTNKFLEDVCMIIMILADFLAGKY